MWGVMFNASSVLHVRCNVMHVTPSITSRYAHNAARNASYDRALTRYVNITGNLTHNVSHNSIVYLLIPTIYASDFHTRTTTIACAKLYLHN